MHDFLEAYKQCDFILTPSTPSAAFAIGENEDDPIKMYLNDVFTVTVNLAGLPGLSVPAGLSQDGLPLGLQLIGRPLDELHGPVEARGATVAGSQIHSVRLPSFVVSTEIVFAADGERLTLRHDAGETPAPYVAGTLLAVRAVQDRAGVTRGLDALLA